MVNQCVVHLLFYYMNKRTTGSKQVVAWRIASVSLHQQSLASYMDYYNHRKAIRSGGNQPASPTDSQNNCGSVPNLQNSKAFKLTSENREYESRQYYRQALDQGCEGWYTLSLINHSTTSHLWISDSAFLRVCYIAFLSSMRWDACQKMWVSGFTCLGPRMFLLSPDW